MTSASSPVAPAIAPQQQAQTQQLRDHMNAAAARSRGAAAAAGRRNAGDAASSQAVSTSIYGHYERCGMLLQERLDSITSAPTLQELEC